MTDIRFVRKDGQSVAIAIVRKRFFLKPPLMRRSTRATQIWHDAMAGDADARELIDLCDIEILDADTGFGFL